MNKNGFVPLKEADALIEYESSYRHPNLPPFEAGPPLDLFPDQPVPTGINPLLTWKDSWPFGDRAGVYMIYSTSFELLYVGKASMNACLGHRLYTYFGGSAACVLKQNFWKQPPRFVINVAVPIETPFEAPALEEFLIRKLKPMCNICGT